VRSKQAGKQTAAQKCRTTEVHVVCVVGITALLLLLLLLPHLAAVIHIPPTMVDVTTLHNNAQQTSTH
jgi:hypothetical protein